MQIILIQIILIQIILIQIILIILIDNADNTDTDNTDNTDLHRLAAKLFGSSRLKIKETNKIQRVMTMMMMIMMMVMMMMITQQIPTMTKTHHGGNLSVMNMVGICR